MNNKTKTKKKSPRQTKTKKETPTNTTTKREQLQRSKERKC